MALTDKQELNEQYVIDSLNNIVMNPKTKSKDRLRAQFLLGCAFGYETYVEEDHNPNSVMNSHNRRSRLKNTISDLTEAQWKETLEHFDYSCSYCGSKAKMTREHFIPLVSGGGYTKTNIIPACFSCNSSKSDTPFYDWYKKHINMNALRVYKILNFVR